MSAGLEFIKSVLLKDPKITFMADYSVTDEMFDKEEQRVLKFIKKYIQKYGKLPSIEKLIARYDELDFGDSDEELPTFLADRLSARNIALKIDESLPEISELLQSIEPDEALTRLAELYESLNLTRVRVKHDTFADLSAKILDRHDNQQRGLLADTTVPIGFASFDSQAGGFRQGETYAIVGESGIGKTHTLCRMALAAYLIGRKILFVSMEMRAEEIATILMGMLAKVDSNKIRRGELSTFEGRERYVKNLSDVTEKENPFWIVDGSLMLQVENLEATVQALGPDVVYGDGAYLLKTKYSAKDKWVGIAEAHERIKILTAKQQIPFIGTYQFNDKGETYGGKSIKHLAGGVIDLLYEEDQPDDVVDLWAVEQTRILNWVKGRYGEQGKIRVSYNMMTSKIDEIERLPWKPQKPKKKKR